MLRDLANKLASYTGASQKLCWNALTFQYLVEITLLSRNYGALSTKGAGGWATHQSVKSGDPFVPSELT